MKCNPLVLTFLLLHAATCRSAAQPTMAIQPPRNLIAIPGEGQVTLNWQPAAGATSYSVKRAGTRAGSALIVTSNLVATSFVDTTLKNDTSYYYAVAAVAVDGESFDSGRVAASPSAPVVDLLPAGAKLEKLATGFQFTEGPVWRSDQGGFLIFSDIDGNTMYRWDPHSTSVFRKSSNKANGNTLDLEGRLVTCEPQAGRVVRTEPDGTVTVLASQYLGKRFNGPARPRQGARYAYGSR